MNLLNSKQPDPYSCQKCGSFLFQQINFMVKLSRIMYPDLNSDKLQPITTFRCVACKHIPDELNPLQDDDQSTQQSNNIII